MTIFQSIILGIVQGITEFLPISSSAHLVIVPRLLGWTNIPAKEAFVFDVLVQVATLPGVFAFFWSDVLCIARAFIKAIRSGKPFGDGDARLGWYLILATIPAGVTGLVIRRSIERSFASPQVASFFLLFTAALLVLGERAGKRARTLDTLTWVDALWIGLFQSFAVFPGVSRSGSTITAGMTRNLERPAAARFAFLMAIPIMLAAGLLAGMEIVDMGNRSLILPVFIPGFIASAITGYLSIRWLLAYLNHRSLYLFSIYCAVLSLITLIVILI